MGRRRSIIDALRAKAEEPNGRHLAPPEQYPEDQRGGACEDGHTLGDRPSPAARVHCLAEVNTSAVRWLWPRWIPLGCITVLDGDPGLGKSTMTLDWAARVSQGWPFPGEERAQLPAAGALLLSAEDDLARTIRPRLDAAKANVQKVFALSAFHDGSDDRPPLLPLDLDRVRGIIGQHAVKLVIIDPFLAYLDGDLDAHKDQDVRRCLHLLKNLAEQTGAAVVIVRHLNKMGHSVALYRGGGSIGIIGAARSGLIVGRHPSEPRTNILASIKSNLGPPPQSLSYSLEPAGDVAVIGWGGEVDLDANDILGHATAGRRKRPTGVDECAAAIVDAVADAPMESGELNEKLTAMGFSVATIRRARKQAGVVAQRVGFGAEGKWMVQLPADPEPTPD